MNSISFLLFFLSITTSSFAQKPTFWQRMLRPITAFKLSLANMKQSRTIGVAGKSLYIPKIQKYESTLAKSPFQPAKSALVKVANQVGGTFTSLGNKFSNGVRAGVTSFGKGYKRTAQSMSDFGNGVRTSVGNGFTSTAQKGKNFGNNIKNKFQSRFAKVKAEVQTYKPVLDAWRDVRLTKTIDNRKRSFEKLASQFENKPALTPSERGILEASANKLGLNDRLAFLDGKEMIPERGLGLKQILNNRKIDRINSKWPWVRQFSQAPVTALSPVSRGISEQRGQSPLRINTEMVPQNPVTSQSNVPLTRPSSGNPHRIDIETGRSVFGFDPIRYFESPIGQSVLTPITSSPVSPLV